MIKTETLPNRDIDCVFDGEPARLFVEYNSATVGMIKHMRETGHSDKDIKDLLLGNVDIAFKIAEDDVHVKEVHDGQIPIKLKGCRTRGMCPSCFRTVSYRMSTCPKCNQLLDWSTFKPPIKWTWQDGKRMAVKEAADDK